MVREFYASYVATLRSQIHRRDAPAKQAPLVQVRFRGMQVDISLPAIRRFLFGESVDATWIPLTSEFDYRWQIVKDGQFLREPALRETTKRWMALHMSVDGEGADWVTEPKGAIRRPTSHSSQSSCGCSSVTTFPPQLLITSSPGIEQC